MGTTFMVPIHGSCSEVSTLGETIESVLLYEQSKDRIRRLKRNAPEFGHFMYNPQSGVLVLRLTLRVRGKSRYFVRRLTLHDPPSAEIWDLLANSKAANVEVRKSRAADSNVDISEYYTAADEARAAMEVPKDSLGRMWDRLEENRCTSWAFHSLVRRFGFHVELFLDEREFDTFWSAHSKLPLSKIQLRFVRRDGLPHSPIGDRDCISADLFMRRSASPEFIHFINENLGHARFNPGKHSL
jgi:hypothetical protein